MENSYGVRKLTGTPHANKKKPAPTTCSLVPGPGEGEGEGERVCMYVHEAG